MVNTLCMYSPSFQDPLWNREGKGRDSKEELIKCLHINTPKPLPIYRPRRYISIPFQIQLEYHWQSSFPILLNMIAGTPMAAVLSFLNYRLSMPVYKNWRGLSIAVYYMVRIRFRSICMWYVSFFRPLPSYSALPHPALNSALPPSYRLNPSRYHGRSLTRLNYRLQVFTVVFVVLLKVYL